MLNRFNMSSNKFLSMDELRWNAPSIFTDTSADRTSDRYTHIPTIKIVEGLIGEGFQPVKAMQSNSRSQDKRLHTKHMLRFRHVDAVANQKGLFPELVLVNSHDGLSSYRLMAGIFRLVCTNGLIAGETFNEIRVRHQGDIIGNVIEGTYSVMKDAAMLIDHADNMSGIILSSDEKRIFSEAVHQIRFNGETVDESGIKPAQFLQSRRMDDKKDDLFTVFNVAQENVIRGGLSGYAVDENGRYRMRETGQRVKKVSTREIKSIDQSNALNRALWTLAEKMAELKQ